MASLPPELVHLILESCSLRELCAAMTTSSSSPWAVLAKEDGIWKREAARLHFRHRPVAPLYREVVTAHARFGRAMSALPPPTSEQLINFVEYMASAHSWYKHLANGAPCHFFKVHVSPTAGMRYHDGRYIDYTEDDGTRFHYTWMTTARYRSQFGVFDYDYAEYDESAFGSATVSTVDGERALLPRALREDLIPVTATVHVASLCYGLFNAALEALSQEETLMGDYSQLTPSHFTSRMTRRMVKDDDLSDLPLRARAHAEQSIAAVIALRRWFDARESEPFCVEQVDDSFLTTAVQMLGSVPLPASDEPRSSSEMDSLARALMPRVMQISSSARSSRRARTSLSADVAVVFDRARQWAALGGAAQRAVRAVWGVEAANALGDMPRECALRSARTCR